ncbi:hypothetical protein L3Q67_02295 [Saccharothrix sp. AJ9571]|nr:hypothetical protein L3Q67_02295 [Saccharothrix sp. AJ9571]
MDDPQFSHLAPSTPLLQRVSGVALAERWPTDDDLSAAERRAAIEDAAPDIGFMKRVYGLLRALPTEPEPDEPHPGRHRR